MERADIAIVGAGIGGVGLGARVRGARRRAFAVLGGGTGIGGFGLGARLRESGRRSFAVLEADTGIGGTWRANTYPGLACDIPSHLYSYSFAPRPDWTRRYPPREEIMSYLDDFVDEHGLRP